MSTTTLSQRLRDLKAMCITHGERHSIPNETAHWLMVGAVDELEKAIAQAEAMEAQVNRFACDNGDSIELVGHAGGAAAEGLYSFVICNVVEGGTARTVTYYREAQAGDGERYPTMKEYTERMADKFAHELAASQAIGEQTPVAKPNDWSNPEFRAKTFLERMLRLRADVSMWQGKHSVLRHENNRLRAKPSPEARDIAIEALATVIELWRDELVNEGYDTSTNFDKATQALSALRGQ